MESSKIREVRINYTYKYMDEYAPTTTMQAVVYISQHLRAAAKLSCVSHRQYHSVRPRIIRHLLKALRYADMLNESILKQRIVDVHDSFIASVSMNIPRQLLAERCGGLVMYYEDHVLRETNTVWISD